MQDRRSTAVVIDTDDLPSQSVPSLAAVQNEQRPDRLDDAAGVPLADRFTRKLRELERQTTVVFAVPGWDGDLALRLRKFTQQDIQRLGNDNARAVLAATQEVLLRQTDDGPLTPVDGGWTGIAGLLGDPEMALPDAVRRVFDPSGENAIRLGLFVEDVLSWMAGEQTRVERALGE